MPPSATPMAASNCRSSSSDAGQLIWDPADRTQFMRPRWRDPSTGRFTRLDPFAGIAAEPQSLHKYNYASADPVNGIDPSGLATLTSLAIGTGIRGAMIGTVAGAIISEVGYFFSTPAKDWSVNGALASVAQGAAFGAFGATTIGAGYFVGQGVYQGVQVWRDPNSTGLQKALASANILLSTASAYLLKGQVRSQISEWRNVYSKLPLGLEVQRDLQAIRSAFASKTPVKFGNITIEFADKSGSYGFIMGGIDDTLFLTHEAINASDDILMKTLIEENLHLMRVRQGYAQTTQFAAGDGARLVQPEEAIVGKLTDDIFFVGRQRGWW